MEFWLIRLAEKNLKALGAEGAAAVQASGAPVTQDRSDLYRFRAALSTVPERFRAVLVLAVIEQMPATEIAYSLGLSPAGAMRRLRAALKSIGVALEKQEAR
jgi:DNA-directed RNA polymerase specialized sigma24 family protein